MKRTFFGLLSVTVALLIVFAPRPEAELASPAPERGGTVLVGQVLAPSFDAIDVKDKEGSKPLQDLRPILLIGLVSAVFLAAGRVIFTLYALKFLQGERSRLGGLASRAPPLTLI